MLALVKDLSRRLNEAEVAYCHWKSNEHLAAGAAGLTDLDLLVDRRHGLKLQHILCACGFKRFAAPPLRAYPAVEDYLGLDDATGCLVHLHMHYELTLGERHLKGYRLPWEARVLQTRRLEPSLGIYTADPVLELLMLLVRAALKLRLRDRIGRHLPARHRGKPSDFERELAWLRERTQPARVLEEARDRLGPACMPALTRLLAGAHGASDLSDLAKAVRPTLRAFRTYGPLDAPLRAWSRELHWYLDAVNRRHLNLAIPLRRICPRGGTVIVLVGSDGTGKSTLSRTLKTWLGWKLDVVPIYFGSGEGQAAIYRKPLRIAHRYLRAFLGRTSPASLPPDAASPASARAPGGDVQPDARETLRALARIPWAIALSLEKRGKLRRMIRARNRGMIVICDRYPQSEVHGFNDGPLLSHWRNHRRWICRALSEWEGKPYLQAVDAAPELVVKLVAAHAVVSLRRPEMSPRGIERRISAVQALRFGPTTKVVELDASSSLEAIALAAKRYVWAEL